MAETNIEWAHYTVNAWTGCTKISPACKHCYAERDTPTRIVEHAMGVQFGKGPTVDKHRLPMWGGHDVRTGEGYRVETVGWEKQLRALNRKAKRLRENARDATIVVGGQEGCLIEVLRGLPYKRPRVFINSLSDTFETFEGPVYRKQNGRFEVVANSLDDVRRRLFAVIEECDELDILLLTKRPGSVLGMVPFLWSGSNDYARTVGKWPSHVWFGTTVENQEMSDKRIPELLKIPARVRFLSMEPLLGKVGLDSFLTTIGNTQDALPPEQAIHWVIVGGESGKNARPMHPDWARKIRDQCQATGVPFFFKQWGEWEMFYDRDVEDPDWRNVPKAEGNVRHLNLAGGQGFHGERLVAVRKVGKKNAGRLLDGRLWDEMPEVKR